MNIVLDKKHIEVSAIDKFGQFFIVSDFIGFTSESEVEGFNRWNTLYTDSDENPYPKVDDLVLYLEVFHNKYKGNTSVRVKAEGDKLRVGDLVEDYEEIRYHYKVPFVADGWYSIHAFLLPLVPGQADLVYFDVDEMKPRLVGTDAIIEGEELLGVEGTQHVNIERFICPVAERSLNDLIGQLSDAARNKGACSEEFLSLRKKVDFAESIITGAKVRFDDGYPYEAQKMIEYLLSLKTYGNC